MSHKPLAILESKATCVRGSANAAPIPLNVSVIPFPNTAHLLPPLAVSLNC